MRTLFAMLIAGLSLATLAAELAQRTALEDYFELPDDSHGWQIAAVRGVEDARIVGVDMVSQRWLADASVDRTEWRSPSSVRRPNRRTAGDAVASASEEELDIDTLTTEILGDRLYVIYVNWTPSGDIRASALAVARFLEAEGCANGIFQLESGAGITLPPVR